jgi:hypothetical protein
VNTEILREKLGIEIIDKLQWGRARVNTEMFSMMYFCASPVPANLP